MMLVAQWHQKGVPPCGGPEIYKQYSLISTVLENAVRQ